MNSSDPPLPDAAGTWNQRYEGDSYLFGTVPNEWLRQHAAIWTKGDRVLCVADGEGRNSVWLAARGLSVEAFDIAEAGVEKARRLATAAGVKINCSVASCDEFSWPECAYDGVVAIFVQFADPDMRKHLFANMIRALKPGGRLVLLGYTPRQLEYRTGGPPFASHLYTEQLLRESFAELRILELKEFEANLAEGTGHSGRSALIGMVAIRQ